MREQVQSDLFYIEIMIDRFSKIEEYTERFKKLGLNLQDEMVIDNLSFQLEQAGEQLSQNRISEQTRTQFSHINWKDMKRFRNFISHSYVRKNNAVLMKIFQKDVPIYIEQLYQVRNYLLRELNKNNE
ncbi:HepT-like ribonuclease domain-containing protein [Enterococcus sp. DIV1420a]|uniref:HepT-like ribonuclease domain-containing protein n=1 Tax=Enterococcus sp. DIV1420a TaxID=2774672 RepID=UPI003F28CDC5